MYTEKDEMIEARCKVLVRAELEISSWRFKVQQSKGREDEGGKKKTMFTKRFCKTDKLVTPLAVMISIGTSCPACPKDLPCDSLGRSARQRRYLLISKSKDKMIKSLLYFDKKIIQSCHRKTVFSP